jgi:hypothetical protein
MIHPTQCRRFTLLRIVGLAAGLSCSGGTFSRAAEPAPAQPVSDAPVHGGKPNQSLPRWTTVQFQVLVDGQKRAESPLLLPKKVHELVVDLGGAKEVTLRVLNGGDGYSYDHAVWGLARFLKAGTKDPFAGLREIRKRQSRSCEIP